MRGSRDHCRVALTLLFAALCLLAAPLTRGPCLAEPSESSAETADEAPDIPVERLEAIARERRDGPPPAYDKALYDLFRAYRRDRVTDKAQQTMQSLLALREKTFGKTAPETLEAAREFAAFYQDELNMAQAYEVTKKYRDLVEKDLTVHTTWLVALTQDLVRYTDDMGERVSLLASCADVLEEYPEDARAEDVLEARLLTYDVRKDSRAAAQVSSADEVARRLWRVHENLMALRVTQALGVKGDAEDRREKAREAFNGLASFYDNQALEEISFLGRLFFTPRSDDIYSREQIEARAVATYSNLEKSVVDARSPQDDLLSDVRWKLVAACHAAGVGACPDEKLDKALKDIVSYEEKRFKDDQESLLPALNAVIEAYNDRPAIKTDSLMRRRDEIAGLVAARDAERDRKDREETERARRLLQSAGLAEQSFGAYEGAQTPEQGGGRDRALALMSEAMTTARDTFASEQEFLRWVTALGDRYPQRSTVFEVTVQALLARDPTGNLLRKFHAHYIEHLQEGEYFHEALSATDASLEQAKRLWPGDRQHLARLEAYRTAVMAALAPTADRATMQQAVSNAALMRAQDRSRLFNKVLAAGDMERALSIARQALSESTPFDQNDLLLAATLFVTADRRADGVLRAYLKRLATMDIKLGEGEVQAMRLSAAALRLFDAAVTGNCEAIERTIQSGKPIGLTNRPKQNQQFANDGFGMKIYEVGMRRLVAICYRRIGNTAKALASMKEDDGLPLSEVAIAVRAKKWAVSYGSLGKLLSDVGQDGRPFSPADALAGATIAPGTSLRKLVTGMYVSVAAQLPADRRPETFDELLLSVGQYSEQAAAKAIAQAAARTVGGPDLAEIVRKRQELETLDSARKLLPGGDNSGVGHEIEALDRVLKQRFPSYAELLNPRSVGLHELRAILDPDEALVLTVETDAHLGLPEALYVLILTAEEFHWYRASMSPSAVREAVLGLRCGLDEEEWATDSGGTRCGQLLGISAKLDKSRPLPFHLGKAHELHEAVFGPARSWIKDKRLLVVPSGSLSSLPLHVLVTEKPPEALPATFAAYKKAAWLARSNAIAIVPSVASLASFRGIHRLTTALDPVEPLPSSDDATVAAGAAGAASDANAGTNTPQRETAIVPHAPHEAVPPRAGYLGYGNPLLAGGGEECHVTATENPCEDDGKPVLVASSSIKRATVGGRGARRSKGANVDAVFSTDDKQQVASAVRALCPLPDTADEIKCVARHFTEPEPEIRLAAQATEAELKSMSANGRLARFRILHFATHGLLAGDVERMTKQQGEPALVMTPPEHSGAEGDDGLLLASEVAALKLDADWVILSACNTAAGDKIGAEALSGLARAFFFAGARSLLVSHWPVYSDAAVRLTTHIFDALDRSPAGRRADALRQSMLALMDDPTQEDNPHPAVWAPFVLVGEGH